jgi:GT2 family glycosyltransferase
MQFAVVVNSFNRRDLLAKALESLTGALKPTALEYAIVVFEAGSTDGSREWLAEFSKQHPEIKIEITEPSRPDDSSFAAGVSQGCDLALRLFPEIEFLFLYETDNWIASAEPVAAAMELLRQNPELAAAGFTVRRHSGSQCGWGGSFPTILSFVLGPFVSMRLGLPHCRIKMHETRGIRWFNADVVYTSPLLIRASVWRSSGGLDARLFPFSDSDLDWAWKVAKAGSRLAVIESGEVVHDNLSVLSGWSSMRVIDFHRSRFRLLRKYRGSQVMLAIPLLFLRHLAEYAILLALVIAGRRPKLSLKKRQILMKSVWAGYESAV